MHAQFIANAGDHLIGAGIDIKRTVPRLETDKGFKTNESLISITALSYFQFNTDHYKGVIKCMLAQNAPDLGMIGGYAVKTIDPLTDKRTYTNIAVGTTFLDVQREGILEPGLFVGILKNLGAGSSIIPSIPDTSVCCSPAPCKSLIVGLGTDVDTLFRIAPRVRYNIDPVVVCAELEYDRAAIGTMASIGDVINTSTVNNVRFLFSMYYFF